MLGALVFLSVFGRGRRPDASTMRWFPFVGAILGAIVGGAWWGADRLLPPLVAAGVVVAVDLALTGMLHLDGLADSADGLLAPLDRDRRLRIMAEPTIGAFALAVVPLVILMRTAALTSRPVSVPLVIGLWCASRSVLALVATSLPYARPGGIAGAFLGDRIAPVAAAVGLVAATALLILVDGAAGAGAVAGLLVASFGVVVLGRRRLGGFTGDLLGAVCVVGETVGLVVAAARW